MKKIPDKLFSELDYDPETGLFTWRRTRKGRGPRAPRAYSCIMYNYVSYLAHRVAWFLTHGEQPECAIDHINGDPSDNRLVNLRLAPGSTNQRNRKLSALNTTGMHGVHWRADREKWRVDIYVDHERVPLGHYDDFEDACAARKAAELKYGFHRNHGRKE